MADVAAFRFRPMPRCFGAPKSLSDLVCGRPAAWMRLDGAGVVPAFYCDDCRADSDAPIADDALFRRVAVTIDVVLCGTSSSEAAARREALLLLERAVHGIGGIINLHAMTTAIGRRAPQAPAPRPPAGKGRGQ